MARRFLLTAMFGLLLGGASTLVPLDDARVQQAEPGSFVILSTGYRDLDGDLDMFPDTGETGRVSVTIQNTGTALTGDSSLSALHSEFSRALSGAGSRQAPLDALVIEPG